MKYLIKQYPSTHLKTTCVLLVILLFPTLVFGQLARERTVKDPEVEKTFFSTMNIGISTVENVDKNNLKSSVKHTFGLVSSGVDQFFGLDNGANTKISLDYGITDRLSVGIGRMTFNKVVDIRSKFNVLNQTESGSIPVSVALKGTLGITTLSGLGYSFNDRLSYFGSVMIARKFDALSIQLSPMITYFNRPFSGNEQTLAGLGFSGSYELNDRYALSAEYLPVLSNRNPGTQDAFAIGLNIDTGGHVFQLFLSSAQWHNEPFIMANNSDSFWEGDFRFGFNIHRVFGL
jgi:hypothetical protein